MNLAVGTNPYKAGGKQPTDGAWLDGVHGHVAGKTWFTFARTTDMLNPGPAKTFVFLDEDSRSLNDAMFSVVGPYPGHQNYTMIDWPAAYHDVGSNLAFADGHVEYHRWRDPQTQLTGSPGRVVQPGNVDIEWMAEHATALIRQPRLSAAGRSATNTFLLVVPALKGLGYTLEYKDSLEATSWTPLPAVTASTNGPLELTDLTATPARRYYRAWTP